MGYRTGVIERVPRESNGKVVDGTIIDDDGTPLKFRWPAEWKHGNMGMKGARVRYLMSGNRVRGLKKGFTGTHLASRHD
ncbi:MAG: hypothetical protein Q7R76_06255 [Candidatus Woesearchaeota archaeon]|nr:hypothetical protein [Candidatus Woesearchaeota archaeon]